jgi:LacI family transcriptional regulator
MKRAHEKSRRKRHVLLLLGVYYPAIHQGILRHAREAGWTLDNTYAHNSGLVPTWWRGDGVIALVTHPQDFAAFRRLPSLPMVDLSKGWISHDMPPRLRRAGLRRPRVLYDNAAIGRLAAEHFLERGFRHIAFFNFGRAWMETGRIPAFRRAVEAAGAQYHEIPYYRKFVLEMSGRHADERPAFRELVQTLRRLPKPLGIYTSTDDYGVRVLRACGGAGLSVPEEVAVLGSDNDLLRCTCGPSRCPAWTPIWSGRATRRRSCSTGSWTANRRRASRSSSRPGAW